MGAGGKDCVITLVERKTGFVLIGKLRDRTAESLSRRAVSLMRRHAGLPKNHPLTPTNPAKLYQRKKISGSAKPPLLSSSKVSVSL
jgi:IS30 family transposase